MASKKKPVHDTFEGLCKAGDLVRVFFAEVPGHADIHVEIIDRDGDLRSVEVYPRGIYTVSRVSHVQVLEAAPPPTARTFGDVEITIVDDGDVLVRGECVSPALIELLSMYYLDRSVASCEHTLSAMVVCYNMHNVRIDSDETLTAGCVSLSAAQVRAALRWIDDNT